jgi:hypothetical protein
VRPQGACGPGTLRDYRQHSQHRKSLDLRYLCAQNVPLRHFPIPCRGNRGSSPLAMPRMPVGRSRLAIIRDVIYITLDIVQHNVPRARADPSLPALCTGKPITAGVVAF